MNSSGPRPNAVVVDHANAETLRRVLQAHGILDGEKKVERSRDEVVFPLRPEGREIPQDVLVTGARLTRHTFQPRPKRPRSMREALEDVLTQDELAALGSSYDIIGKIAIIELPNELLERSSDIGERLLSWLPVETVAVKASVTSGQDRVRGLRVVAGRTSLETLHRENGLQFLLDPSKVFFNPRLSGERARLAAIQSSGTVIDMFAGVGPFSIAIDRACRTKAKVIAIDQNKYAMDYLRRNVRLNRAWGVEGVLGDARREVPRFTRHLGLADRIVMNLPKSSVEFLSVAVSSLKREGMLHYYRLADKSDAREAVENELRASGEFRISVFREVESYSPSRSIYVADALFEAG